MNDAQKEKSCCGDVVRCSGCGVVLFVDFAEKKRETCGDLRAAEYGLCFSLERVLDLKLKNMEKRVNGDAHLRGL